MFLEDIFISLTAQIVSAHVAANEVPAAELPALIRHVHQALASVDKEPAQPPRSEPAVNAKKSVFPDHIVCMDCGKSFKTLKRHLSSDHDLTPEQYRAKWNLPASYPIVASEYASQRSQLAKDSGLGRKAAPPPPPAKRGRRAAKG
jgi:predicted transcriptional regulator